MTEIVLNEKIGELVENESSKKTMRFERGVILLLRFFDG